MDRLKAWWSRFQDTPLWQAWKRYGDNRGSLLAGGVGYFAFFSLIPALLRGGVNFYVALALGCLLTVALYAGMIALAPRLGIRL